MVRQRRDRVGGRDGGTGAFLAHCAAATLGARAGSPVLGLGIGCTRNSSSFQPHRLLGLTHTRSVAPLEISRARIHLPLWPVIRHEIHGGPRDLGVM